MVPFPYGVFRRPGDDASPPGFWRVYQYIGEWESQPPGQRASVFLGVWQKMSRKDSQCLVTPASGEWPQPFGSFNDGVGWLQEVFTSHVPGARFQDASTIPLDKVTSEKASSEAGKHRPGTPRPRPASPPPSRARAYTREEYNEILRQRRAEGLAAWQEKRKAGLVKPRPRAPRAPREPVPREPAPKKETPWQQFRRETRQGYTRQP